MAGVGMALDQIMEQVGQDPGTDLITTCLAPTGDRDSIAFPRYIMFQHKRKRK